LQSSQARVTAIRTSPRAMDGVLRESWVRECAGRQRKTPLRREVARKDSAR
jgi:hypothetical protein